MTRPLSVGQEAMWFLHRLAPQSAAYNVTLAVRIRSPLADERLARAVAAVEERHDPLRSVVAEHDGRPVWRIQAASPVDARLRVIDMTGANDQRVHEMARSVAAEPFKLAAGERPLRMVLLRTAPADALLVMTVHHIAVDAPSLFLILRDLLAAYRTGADLPPLRLTYDGWVTRERQLLASHQAERLARHWDGVVAGGTAARLPADRPAPARPGFAGGTCPLYTAPGFVDRLRRAAGAAGVTPFAYLLGAFEAMLHRCTGQNDLIIGTAVVLRAVPALRDTVGYMVNMLPLRAVFGPDVTLAQTVAAAGDQIRLGLAHAAYPSSRIGRSGAGRTPLFRITFTMIAADRMPLPLPAPAPGAFEGPAVDHHGLRLSYVEVPQQEGQFDLSVVLRYDSTSLTGVFRYDSEIFDRGTVEDLVDRFILFADRAVDSPDARVADIPVLGDSELGRLLAFGGVG
jgi:Condensation domain